MFITLFVIFFLLILFSYLDYINLEKKVKKYIIFFIGPVLVFLIVFRFGVPDYDSYIEIFEKSWFSGISSQNSDVHGEIGYLYLNYIIRLLGGNIKVIFFIVGSLSVFLTIRFYTKYTKYYLVAILIYFSHIFLLREMIQIRSGLAISFVMFSIPYLVERKFVKFLALVLTASLIHSICLLFIVVYVCYPYLLTTKRQVIILLIGLALGLIFNVNFVQNVLGYLNVPQIIMDYTQDEEYNYKLGLLNPVLIKQVLVLIILLYNRRYLEEKVTYFNALLVIYILGAFWFATFNSIAILSARVSTMFSNVEHVLIPSLLLLPKYKMVIYIFILLYCTYSFLSKWEMLSSWSFSF